MADELPFKREMVFAYGEPRALFAGVTRIVANNPSPFTFKGTNTYIVGRADGGDGAVAVIDPGPGEPAHDSAILAALGNRKVSHIVLTHTHRDHSDGLPALQAATSGKTVGFGRKARDLGVKKTSASGSEFVDKDFVPDVRLGDGDTLEGDGWSLTALHTPGHAPDHLCFALGGTKVLFSGDHVMSWNTSVVAPPEGNMGDYMRSLDKLLARDDTIYLPGHGGQLEQPQRLVRAFALHRKMREQAILDCVRQGTSTIPEIVRIIYKDLDPRLVNAASLSVLAHVESLIERQLVSCAGAPSLDRPLSPV